MSAASIIATIAAATFRALLGRRRTVLTGLLAAMPILVALLYRLAGEGTVDDRALLDLLVIRTILPLTALIFGTTALGSELDDGTGIALLTKPIPRWQIVAAKVAAAATLTIAFSGVSTVVTTLLLGDAEAGATAAAYLLGVVVGGLAYVTAFVAVSVVTTRALVVGLVYTLLWEGWLAGILPGTKTLSIREATLAVVDAAYPRFIEREGLALPSAVVLLVVVLALGLVVASTRLERYQVRGGD